MELNIVQNRGVNVKLTLFLIALHLRDVRVITLLQLNIGVGHATKCGFDLIPRSEPPIKDYKQRMSHVS